MPFDYFCMVRIDEKFDTLGLKTLKSDLPIRETSGLIFFNYNNFHDIYNHSFVISRTFNCDKNIPS